MLTILGILAQATVIFALTSSHNQSIFLNNGIISYCDMKCESDPAKHTLCEPNGNAVDRCENLEVFDVQVYKESLWVGHNGLRNREARAHGVSNMRRLEWDEELESMAMHWLMQCKENEMDPCTQFNDRKGPSFTRVSQNIGYIKSSYLPQNFYPATINGWYKEVSRMGSFKVRNGTIKFKESNNYTQMVWARVWKMGCASGRYNSGFGVVCNYYGFDGLDNAAWRIGKPCSECPRSLPLCSRKFDNLCTADTAMNHRNLAILTIVLAFVVYCVY